MFKPPLRDTTPNSGREIAGRLGIVALFACLVLAPLLAISAWSQSRSDHAIAAALCALIALGLGLTKNRWQATSPPPPAPSSRPAPVTPIAPTTPSAPTTRPRILLLNGSLAGATGNSAVALRYLSTALAPHAELLPVTLAGPAAQTFATLEPALRRADAVVIATGTHWDSWSSVLQRFLEDATPAEGTALWLGKPVAVLISEHSTGGKGVLSRLQGVLVTLGCQIPPMSGLVLSKTAQLATAHAPADAGADDFWSPADLAIIAHNLLTATRTATHPNWQPWPVDRDPRRISDRWLS